MTEEDRHAWERPTLDEVSDGVWRVPLPLPGDALRAVNAYLVRESGSFLLVDCGWNRRESWERLEEALRRLGSGLHRVQWVFATHVHDDHYGLAGRVRQRSGAPVLLGRGDRESLVAFRDRPGEARQRTAARLGQLAAEDVARRLEAAGSPERRPPADPDLYLAGGEALLLGERELEVVATPGHTRGHLCLHDRANQLLFAGDHVLPQITPSIGVELHLPGSPLADFLESLERVIDLSCRLVLPAHGPVFSDLRGRVGELLEHHRLRLEECYQLVEAGANSAREVADRLPWTRRRRRFQDLDPFNQMLAVFESELHLQLLAERGRLRRDLADSSIRYALP